MVPYFYFHTIKNFGIFQIVIKVLMDTLCIYCHHIFSIIHKSIRTIFEHSFAYIFPNLFMQSQLIM